MTRRRRFLVPFVVCTLLLGACSSGSDDDDGDQAAEDRGQTELTADTAEPQYGGRVIYGIEADTGSPWNPARVLCAAGCQEILRSVFDPIAEIGEDGSVQPVLAESIEHNEDYTVWTVKVRPGIEFHDGTPLDADALVAGTRQVQASPTLAIAAKDLDDVVKVDEMTVEYHTKRPWVAFDYVLTTQVGFVASPTWLAAVDAGTADVDEPVGTGAFVFESYEPGGSFVATRNDDYWRTDAEGRELPYLDAIEFKIFDEVQSRTAALESGQIQLMHTANGDTIRLLRETAEAGSINLIENSDNAETNYLMLNSAAEGSPVTDVRVRRAIAHAIDSETVNEARFGGVFPIANGPFPPGVPGYLEDTGFPTYDPDAARALVEEYESDVGPVEFSLKTTSDEFNLLTAQLLQQMLDDVGMDVELDQQEQGQFVLQAAQGQFEAFTFRNLSVQDPDQNVVFWSSDTSAPPGTLAINFGRVEDEVIDENLDIIRTNDDPEARTAAAEAINRRFAEQVYNVWLAWGEWAIASSPDVHQIATGYNLPDGGENLGMRNSQHQVNQIWLEQ